MIVLPFDKSKDSIFCQREDKDSETVILLGGGKLLNFCHIEKFVLLLYYYGQF